MVSSTSGGWTPTFAYDAENRPVGVSGAASVTFVYDSDGRRGKATVNGITLIGGFLLSHFFGVDTT
ncbi:MAG: hypothetical protein NZ553_13850 [Caldilinea sp.]|nr:hypothetical protein [Caldilinea sp.]MDW8441556.1 hypothetical protein [Caldilineaceae bacterium]